MIGALIWMAVGAVLGIVVLLLIVWEEAVRIYDRDSK